MMKFGIIGGLLYLGVIIGALAAYLTHLYWAITTLMSDVGATIGQIVLSILGTFVPPIGMVHGLILWFN